jgi:gliding motility-associated-like protein
MRKNYILFFLLVLSPILSYASHVRAGEITATRLPGSQLTYRVTLITYTDEIGGKPANDGQEYVDFSITFGANRAEKMRVYRKGNRTPISRATIRNVYDTTYTFPAAGYYTIGCSIVNRNENTINLPDPQGSGNISFFVQTSILINSNIGYNSTPVLLNIPIDSAAVGQRFIHNPGAFDIDGDSLSYKLTIPRKDEVNTGTNTTTGRGIFIPEYLAPNTVGPSPVLNQAGTGPATFSINPITGDLIWDVPRQVGQYNVAFVIEEWRKGYDGRYVRIGEIVRDMQIIVVETENVAPVLKVPDDICVEAGEKVEFEVTGEDENLQQLKLTTSGGVYNLDAAGKFIRYIADEAAVFTSTPSISKVVGKFEWNTNCQHARDQAYNIVFKVEDTPGRFVTQLVDLKSINIRVLPPRPKALTVEEGASGNMLKWNKVGTCTEEGKVLVYRKSGCSGMNPSLCTTGMPASWGYELIGEVNISDSTFLDNKAELGGVYSYRLITQVAENEFINLLSAPSIEFCVGKDVTPGSNVITKVSVSETSKTSGEIDITWTKPVNVNLQDLKAPYVYKLYRAIGIGGENFTLIHTQVTSFENPADTTFTDTNLNTEDNVYRYKVEFYTETSKLNGSSNPASSVRLSARTSDSAVPLTWETNTPWSNENNTHYIYREDPNNADSYNLIHKLEVTNPNSFTYIDRGLDNEAEDGDISMELINGDTYCYRVLTQGEYESFMSLGTLQNYSQIVCSTPLDQSPPCTPILAAGSAVNCEQMDPASFCNENSFTNQLTWTNPTDSDGNICRTDIVSYEIYFARYENSEPILIANLPNSGTNQYFHNKNKKDGFAGCYYIKARNSIGLESPVSQKICFDNCDVLSFPNAFSPNGDGKNDTFTAMNCAAFIKEATLEIYSAHGQRVRKITSDSIVWDGKDENGRDMPSGSYYYTISVTFERLAETGSTKEFKGYVTLIK